MRLAPIGAFGAMAFTVGRYGVGTLLSLGQLMAGMYVDLPAVRVRRPRRASPRAVGFSLIRFLKYISEEILIVLGTSSSESALPKIMEKLERIGCPKPVVGLVVPTGYSFNLDGTSIYMTMAALFVAQASGVHLSLGQQLSLLGDSAADVEGRGGGDRQRLHHARRDARRRSRTSRSPGWRCCSASIASCPKRARSPT